MKTCELCGVITTDGSVFNRKTCIECTHYRTFGLSGIRAFLSYVHPDKTRSMIKVKRINESL